MKKQLMTLFKIDIQKILEGSIELTFKRCVRGVFLLLAFVYVVFGTGTASAALSTEQLKALDGGIYYYNVKDCDAGAAAPEAAAATATKIPIPDNPPVVDNTGLTNAQIPADRLTSMRGIPYTTVTGSDLIRKEIVEHITKLAAAFHGKFNRNLNIFSGYRDLAQQQQSLNNATRTNSVAPLGESSHGWGLAIDIEQAKLHDVDTSAAFGSEEYKWLVEEAVKLGWKNPYYQGHGGQAAEEPWHWEYGTTSSWGAGTNGQTSSAKPANDNNGLWARFKGFLASKALAQEATPTPTPTGEPNASTPGTSGTSTGGKAFMVGDSITNGAKTDLTTAIQAKGYNPLEIDARDGRPLSEGVTVLQSKKDTYKDASVVIIALGTNGGVTADAIKSAIDAIKSAPSNAKIYWVNVGANNDKRTSGGPIDFEGINKTLQDNATAGYTVIDWGAQVKAHPDYVNDDGLGVHLTPDGYKAFAETIANALSGGGAPASQGGGCSCSAGGSATLLAGSDNEEKTWNFLVSKGFNTVQAAGSMGNLRHEGNFTPDQLEIAYSDPPHKWDKPLELPAVRGPDGQPGLGIAQWTSVGRKEKLLEHAKNHQAKSIIDLGVQLEFLWIELSGPYKAAALDPILASNDLAEVTRLWQEKYEVGANFAPRFEAAQEYLAKYGSNTAGQTTTPDSGGTTSSTGGGGSACASSGATGQVVGNFSLPIPKSFYDENNKIFSNEHWAGDAAVDISVPTGTEVFSVAAGKILVAPAGGDCGVGVTIQSESGGHWTYCHGSDGGAVEGAKTGDTVRPGQLIMHSASTGRSSGPHLHFQLKEGGSARCPQPLLVGIAKGTPPDPATLPSSGCTNGL